jgi:5-methyltetrahydropteroyltriglutamate--homocysteine methyltransferase
MLISWRLQSERRWLQEWVNPKRHGSFAPLRHVPSNKTIVLGLLTTKSPESLAKEALIVRIHEASQYININQLCISGQCDFASSQHGNKISFEDQDQNISLLMEVAKEVWGDS